MQISTSVQQTTEVVVLKAAAITLRAATRVIVCQGTPEMDLPAQVNKESIVTSGHGTASSA